LQEVSPNYSRNVIRDLQGGEVFLDSPKDAVRLEFLRDSGRFGYA